MAVKLQSSVVIIHRKIRGTGVIAHQQRGKTLAFVTRRIGDWVQNGIEAVAEFFKEYVAKFADFGV